MKGPASCHHSRITTYRRQTPAQLTRADGRCMSRLQCALPTCHTPCLSPPRTRHLSADDFRLIFFQIVLRLRDGRYAFSRRIIEETGIAARARLAAHAGIAAMADDAYYRQMLVRG